MAGSLENRGKLRELIDKFQFADQYAISLIIRATGICWNQVVCKGMAGGKRILLKIRL